MNHAENGGVGANTKCKRKCGRDGKARRLAQHSPRITDVAQRFFSETADADIADVFLHAVEAPDLHYGLAAGRNRIDTPRNLPGRDLLDVRPQLLVELRVQPPPAGECAPEACDLRPEGHGDQSDSRTSPTAETMRAHCFFSAASCCRPAGVSRYALMRRPPSVNDHSPAINPSCSSRCSAGNNDPAFTVNVPLVICSMRSAIATPCRGSSSSVRRISKPSVPFRISVD